MLREKQYGGIDMKIKYHCSGRWDNKSLVELIESEKIKYDDLENTLKFLSCIALFRI